MARPWLRLALFLIVLTGTVRTAGAADGPQVSANSGSFTFGESLGFELDATGSADIQDVVLHYTIGADSPRNRRIPDFSPGRSIHAQHSEKVVRGQIPPMSEITWWWTLTDAAGQVTETEARTERYLDTRFDWQHTDGDDVVVWWYGAAPDFAESVAEQARSALADLAGRLGRPVDRPIHIVTYQSRADMLGALIDRGDVFEARLSTLGARVAPDILLLLAGDDNPELSDVVRHELSHTVLHLRLGKEYLDVPAWLDEGLAMYAEGELGTAEAAGLRAATRDDRLLSLRSLTTFPGQAELVPLAYAESQDVVSWLIEQYGEADIRSLLDTLSTGQLSADEALKQVYQADQLALYQAYRADRGLGPAGTPVPGAARPAPASRMDFGPGMALWCLGIWCVVLAAGLLLTAVLWWVLRRQRLRSTASSSTT
jgi:hypothetical protein